MAERSFEERNQAPTPRRREEARRQGEIPRSRAFLIALSLLAAFLALRWVGPRAVAELTALTGRLLAAAGRAPAVLEAGDLRETLAGCWPLALTLAPLVLAGPAAVALGAAVQGGLAFRLDAVLPRASRLDPMAGLRRRAGGRGLERAALALLQLGTIAWVAFPFGARLVAGRLGAGSPAAGGSWGPLAGEMLDLGLRAALALAALSGLDYLLERRRFERELRMTQAEAREETRRIEGDPEWRVRRRSLRSRLLDSARAGHPAGGGA
jgi:flagellar biosynthetic protein FlhB